MRMREKREKNAPDERRIRAFSRRVQDEIQDDGEESIILNKRREGGVRLFETVVALDVQCFGFFDVSGARFGG